MSETAPLLGDVRPADGPGPSGNVSPRVQFRYSPEVLLIPVAVATKLATLIPSTTLIELVRRAVCSIWSMSHRDPVTLIAGQSVPPDVCDAPEVQRYFATVMAILGAVDGLLVMAAFGITSRISSRYGRKPAILFALAAGLAGSCLISAARFVPDWLSNRVLLVGMSLGLLSGSTLYTYLVNMYIVDVCVPEDRTAALSKIAGWSSLGICISFALGGNITTKTGNPLIVFYTAAGIFLATFIYVLFVLPESFPEEKRNALSLMRPETSVKGFFGAPLLIFEPLKMLLPVRRSDGTRNWRLVWCAAHAFVFAAAHIYAPAAWLVLATSKYHLTPADTGLFLTITSLSSTIILTLIIPPVVRSLRPYYIRRNGRSRLADDDVTNGEELETDISDRLDVHLAFVTCVVAAISYLGAAASKTIPVLIFSGICIGFTYLHIPTTHSLVAGSVDPLKQGEAFAAIDMVSHAGGALSPIIMGSILTATINKMPLLMFYVHLGAVLISTVPLFFVRDADRYRKLREA